SMLRAAAAPERFLERGFARFLARAGAPRRSPARAVELGVVLPPDLARFLEIVDGVPIGDFIPRTRLPKLPALVTSARRGGAALARLSALLAGAVPIGENRLGEVIVYFVADAPARGLVASIDPHRTSMRLVCRGAAELAVLCSRVAAGEDP